MNWTMIFSVVGALFNIWRSNTNKKNKAEIQLIKLAHKMDRMAEKRAVLKGRIEDLEVKLKARSFPSEEL